MGRFETNRRIKPGIFVSLKETTIKDNETDEVGKGYAWIDSSYENADRKAWKDLQKQNEEGEDN